MGNSNKMPTSRLPFWRSTLVFCLLITVARSPVLAAEPIDTATRATDGYTSTALRKHAIDAQVSANVGYFGQTAVPADVIADVAKKDRQFVESQRVLAKIAPPESLSPTETQLPPPTQFNLVAGEPLEEQLFAWAKRAGWKILWNLPDDANWIVPGNQQCGSDFELAVKHVTETLAANGIDIVGDSWRGNRTIVLSQSGATDQ